QRRTRSGSRDSVDHPPGAKDDVANALAGVCDAVMQRKFVAGAIPIGLSAASTDGGMTPFEKARQAFEITNEIYLAERERLARAHQRSAHDEGFREFMRRNAPWRLSGF